MRICRASLCLVILLAGFAPLHAGVIDQQNLTFNDSQPVLLNAQALSQVFTVGATGTLDQVDVYLSKYNNFDITSNPINVRILTTSGGSPASTVLGTGQILAADVGLQSFSWISVPFDVQVNAGDVLAISLSSTNSKDWYEWGISNTNAYAGGVLYRNNGGESGPWSVINSSYDTNFKTYVTATAAVPEPSSMILLGIGAAGMFGYRLRRRAAAVA